MAKSNWNKDNISDQSGKVIIITGATSGLGKEAARVLAGKKATVIMAVRNIKKGDNVLKEIQEEFPGSDLLVRELDLARLKQVKKFSKGIKKDYDHIDILIK
jgi:short-subunit dehydrogenase